jgi:hypothetical protein
MTARRMASPARTDYWWWSDERHVLAGLERVVIDIVERLLDLATDWDDDEYPSLVLVRAAGIIAGGSVGQENDPPPSSGRKLERVSSRSEPPSNDWAVAR